jgi:hypothetical protein
VKEGITTNSIHFTTNDSDDSITVIKYSIIKNNDLKEALLRRTFNEKTTIKENDGKYILSGLDPGSSGNPSMNISLEGGKQSYDRNKLYQKTAQKYKGKQVMYKKGDDYYVKKKNALTGKFGYRKVKL